MLTLAALEAKASFALVRTERPTEGRAFVDLAACVSPLLGFGGRRQRAQLSGVCAGMRAAIAELPPSKSPPQMFFWTYVDE